MWLLMTRRRRAKTSQQSLATTGNAACFWCSPGSITTSLVLNSGGLKTMLFFCVMSLMDLNWTLWFPPAPPQLFPFVVHETYHRCRVLYTNGHITTGREAIPFNNQAAFCPKEPFRPYVLHVEGLNTEQKVKEEKVSLSPGRDTIPLWAKGHSWNCFQWKTP